MKLIVAIDEYGTISKDGKIPWNCPEDRKLFRSMTLGSTILMGRKTFDSLPDKPLKGRFNVVLSNNLKNDGTEDLYHGPLFLNNIEILPFFLDLSNVYCIGGADIYRKVLEKGWVDTIYISKIKGYHNGDLFFPSDMLNVYEWKEYSCKQYEDFEYRELRKC